jgi:type IV pilus assembly protein PilC
MAKSKSRPQGNVPAKDLAIFCSQMAMVLRSDITIMEGVRILGEQTENRLLKDTLGEIYEGMEKGIPFSQSFERYKESVFPEYLTNMVTLGETSGTIDSVFSQMADYYNNDNAIRNKVRAAVTYPAILTVLMLGIIILLVVKILPMFSDILNTMGGTMPLLTQTMMDLSSFIGRNLIGLIVVAAVIIAAAVFYARTVPGRRFFDQLKLSLPFFSQIFTRIITARFARCLAILIKSGVNLLSALEMMQALIGNVYVEERFRKVREEIYAGKDLVEGLRETHIFPPLFLRLVIIGQNVGFLDEMLFKAADIFDEEVQNALERMTTFIEPVMIIILSLIVGVILLSVMLPMISIMNTIG